jgi:hypothetical protein
MIIEGTRKFLADSSESEDELEQVVLANSEYLFGPDSIYLPKSLIRTAEGQGTIPDGFVVDIASRQWFIVEAELSKHSVWNHIAPQIAKQIIAASQAATRRLLIEVVVNRVKEDSSLREKFDERGVVEMDIRSYLTEIFDKPPVIGIPIDAIGQDLREWAQTLKTEVKLWLVRKLTEFGHPQNIIYEIPEEFRPTLETSPLSSEPSPMAFYDVTMADLVNDGLLTPGETLYLSYQPRGAERREFRGTIDGDGVLTVLGQSYTAPSFAALLCIQTAGSDRETVNGWTSWKTAAGKRLDELRLDYLRTHRALDSEP